MLDATKVIKSPEFRHLWCFIRGLLLFFACLGYVAAKPVVGPSPPAKNPPRVYKMISLAPDKNRELRALPLFLAVPDSLCFLDFEKFVWSEDSAAFEMLEKVPQWCGYSDSREMSIKFLVLCRFIWQGKYREAKEAFVYFRRQKHGEFLEYCLGINQGLLKFALGEPDIARKELEKVLKKFPWKEAGWKNLFSINIALEEYEKADILVEEVLDTLPKSIWAQRYKINLIQMLGTENDLAQYLRDKSSWKDSLFAIQISYGKFLKDKGETEMAIKYYSRGLEGNPENGEGWLELSELFFNKGMQELSIQCLENAIQAGINSSKYFEILSGLFRERIYGSFLMLRQKKEEMENCVRSWRPGECSLYYQKLLADIKKNHFEGLTKFAEQAFLQGRYSRNLTQCLYYMYGFQGRVSAARNLKSQFYFHFESPFPNYIPFGMGEERNKLWRLEIPGSSLIRAFSLYYNDFPEI